MRNYKLFGKIPIFDIIIVLVLVVAAVVGVSVLNTSKSGVAYTTTVSKDIILTVRFGNISEQVVTMPKAGELVVDDGTNTNIGTVVSVAKEPYVMHDFNSVTGEPVSTIYNDRYNLFVTIKANAKVSEAATEINGVKVGLGKSMVFSMPSICTGGIITNIEEVAVK